jgi:hypothetical protein
VEIELTREDASLYRRKSFTVIQGKSKIGYLLPGESKAFVVNPKERVVLKIDSITGGKIDPKMLSDKRKFSIELNRTFARSPMIWSALIISAILLPGIFDGLTKELSTVILLAVLLSYLPFLTFFRYRWLKVQAIN